MSGATIAVAALGLSGGPLDAIAETATREAAAAGVAPLFIVDTFDFTSLHRRSALFEQVIDVSRRRWSHPGYAWTQYQERQFELIGRKWRSVSFVVFGGPVRQPCIDAFWRGVKNPVPREPATAG